MITHHPVDNPTLFRAIELLDRYRFVLQKDSSEEACQHIEYIEVILSNLRNALKLKARVEIEDDQAYHGGHIA